jgi:hypothetical protein
MKSDAPLRQGFGDLLGKSAKAVPGLRLIVARPSQFAGAVLARILWGLGNSQPALTGLFPEMGQSHGGTAPDSCRNQSRMTEIRRP